MFFLSWVKAEKHQHLKILRVTNGYPLVFQEFGVTDHTHAGQSG